MKKQFTSILCLVLFVLAGCTNPKDTQVPLSKDTASIEFKEAVATLTEKERQLLKAYMFRTAVIHDLQGTQEPSVTIAEALKAQSEFIVKVRENMHEIESMVDAELLAEEEQLKSEALIRVEQLRKMANVFLVKKEFIPSDYRNGTYQDYVQITCNVKNNYTEDISGLKGALVVNNSFGDHIFTVNLTVEELIPSGGMIEWVGNVEYNQFISEHKALANAELGKIKTIWIPDSYIMANGELVK